MTPPDDSKKAEILVEVSAASLYYLLYCIVRCSNKMESKKVVAWRHRIVLLDAT